MPLNFPNTWGIRNNWNKPVKPQPVAEYEDDGRVINDDGQMKCPNCDRWIDYFNYTADYSEYGTVDSDGDLNGHDMEFQGVQSISCPECGNDVFNSISELTRHYDTGIRSRNRR
jgi:uncharacterized C2H2 Zn-finger protein